MDLVDEPKTMQHSNGAIYKEIPLEDNVEKDLNQVEMKETKKRTCVRKSSLEMKSSRTFVWAGILAQFVALTIAGTGLVNDRLFEKFNVNIPTFLSLFNYLLLALVFLPPWLKNILKEKSLTKFLKERTWKYALVSLADLEANYFMVKAYSMTIITTIQVIDAFILPITVFLSFLFLKHTYRINQILGVAGALLGCALIIVGDYFVKNIEGQHKLIGDAFCLIASILYASSNVGAEFFIRENSKREYLSMIGVFGTIFSCLQMYIFERNEIKSLISLNNVHVWILFGLNSVFMFSIYTLLPCVIAMSSASFLNVNLLSADFYSVLFGIFIKKYELHVLYFMGFGCIIVGTLLYSIGSSKKTRVLNQKRQVNSVNQTSIEMDCVIQKSPETLRT